MRRRIATLKPLGEIVFEDNLGPQTAGDILVTPQGVEWGKCLDDGRPFDGKPGVCIELIPGATVSTPLGDISR